ncbi:hypothetical protein AN958_05533 [Leucoagaricus sp. SymC.cos]|nr:hypothetical protein AN958_05533 [Leucoagaricus sp. SymC.cos]
MGKCQNLIRKGTEATTIPSARYGESIIVCDDCARYYAKKAEELKAMTRTRDLELQEEARSGTTGNVSTSPDSTTSPPNQFASPTMMGPFTSPSTPSPFMMGPPGQILWAGGQYGMMPMQVLQYPPYQSPTPSFAALPREKSLGLTQGVGAPGGVAASQSMGPPRQVDHQKLRSTVAGAVRNGHLTPEGRVTALPPGPAFTHDMSGNGSSVMGNDQPIGYTNEHNFYQQNRQFWHDAAFKGKPNHIMAGLGSKGKPGKKTTDVVNILAPREGSLIAKASTRRDLVDTIVAAGQKLFRKRFPTLASESLPDLSLCDIKQTKTWVSVLDGHDDPESSWWGSMVGSKTGAAAKKELEFCIVFNAREWSAFEALDEALQAGEDATEARENLVQAIATHYGQNLPGDGIVSTYNKSIAEIDNQNQMGTRSPGEWSVPTTIIPNGIGAAAGYAPNTIVSNVADSIPELIEIDSADDVQVIPETKRMHDNESAQCPLKRPRTRKPFLPVDFCKPVVPPARQLKPLPEIPAIGLSAALPSLSQLVAPNKGKGKGKAKAKGARQTISNPPRNPDSTTESLIGGSSGSQGRFIPPSAPALLPAGPLVLQNQAITAEDVMSAIQEGGKVDPNASKAMIGFNMNEIVTLYPVPSYTWEELMALCKAWKIAEALNPGPNNSIHGAIMYDRREEIGRGMSKAAFDAKMSYGDVVREPVVLKRVFDTVTAIDKKGEEMAEMRWKEGADASLAVLKEANLLMWSSALMDLSYDFIKSTITKRQEEPPFEIPRLRMVKAWVATSNRTPAKTKWLGGTTLDATYLIEERIVVDDKFVKYINNTSSAPHLDPDHERYPIAEFLVFLQHVQYEKTYAQLFISDLQGRLPC